MKELLGLAVLTCLALAACVQLGGGHAGEEYAVYKALIEAVYIREDTAWVVLREQATAPGNVKLVLEMASETIPELGADTVQAFERASAEAPTLREAFDLSVTVALLSQQEEDAILRGGGGWDAFYQEYPKSRGLLAVSTVGFNLRKDQALVYVEHTLAPLAGTGEMVVLERKDGAWAVAPSALIWIS